MLYQFMTGGVILVIICATIYKCNQTIATRVEVEEIVNIHNRQEENRDDNYRSYPSRRL